MDTGDRVDAAPFADKRRPRCKPAPGSNNGVELRDVRKFFGNQMIVVLTFVAPNGRILTAMQSQAAAALNTILSLLQILQAGRQADKSNSRADDLGYSVPARIPILHAKMSGFRF